MFDDLETTTAALVRHFAGRFRREWLRTALSQSIRSTEPEVARELEGLLDAVYAETPRPLPPVSDKLVGVVSNVVETYGGLCEIEFYDSTGATQVEVMGVATTLVLASYASERNLSAEDRWQPLRHLIRCSVRCGDVAMSLAAAFLAAVIERDRRPEICLPYALGRAVLCAALILRDGAFMIEKDAADPRWELIVQGATEPDMKKTWKSLWEATFGPRAMEDVASIVETMKIIFYKP